MMKLSSAAKFVMGFYELNYCIIVPFVYDQYVLPHML